MAILKHARYNSILVADCRALKGMWDARGKCWKFSQYVHTEVVDLNKKYNGDLLTIEIVAREEIVGRCDDSIQFIGYPIAKCMGKTSDAHTGAGVTLVVGRIWGDGKGHFRYPMIDAGSRFRLQVSKNLLDMYGPKCDQWGILLSDNNI